MTKLQEIEKEYNEKLKIALLENNYNKISNLFFELNILRKFYKKKNI